MTQILNGLTQPETPVMQLTIIWADDPGQAVIDLRNELRNKGEKAVIRDSLYYAGCSLEPAGRIIFVRAGKRDEIVKDYRSEGYRRLFGDIEIVDIKTGKFGEPIEAPVMTPKQKTEAEKVPDLLDEQLANMSDDDVRTYVAGITGQKPPVDAPRDSMIAALRRHQTGQPPEPWESGEATKDDEDGAADEDHSGAGGL